MLISNIINDSFGLLSKQLRFYCWHFRRNLDQRQRQELIELLHEQHFERLANKIKSLNQSNLADCKQQVGRLLFEHCLKQNRRHQLIQLIESRLVDINVKLDNYGNTLLHRSAYNLDVDLVRLLIDHGANLRLRDQWGNTALHIAILSYRNGAVIYGDGSDVVRNLTSIIKLLLEADRDIQNERCKRLKLHLSEADMDCTSSLTQSTVSGDKRGVHKLFKEDPISSYNNSLPEPSPQEHSESSFSGKKTHNSLNGKRLDLTRKNQSKYLPKIDDRDQDYPKQTASHTNENSEDTISPISSEDLLSPLVDAKNAFGRTALHCCVNVVGERHLAHFVQLLISFGADTDAINTRMETPLYCLVKRPGISAIRQKYLAITHLIGSGCDDLGLSIEPNFCFSEKLIKDLEENISTILQTRSDSSSDPIFTNSTYKRVPSLKHIARLHLKKKHQDRERKKRQARLSLPSSSPATLNLFVNRKILDQSELY